MSLFERDANDSEQIANSLRANHLHAVLWALRRVNQLILRERNPRRMARQICEILVETRGLSSCGVLLMESDGGSWFTEAGDPAEWRRLRAMLVAGRLPDCVQRVLVGGTRRWVPISQGICPECPARPDHGAAGEAVLIPLQSGERVFGVLAAGLPAGLSLDEEETGLLEEVAGDVAFALRNIEAERDRDQGEANLRASREHLATIVDFAPVAMYSLTLEGLVMSWNHAAEETFQWSAAEVIGRHLPTIPELAREEFEQISERIRTGAPVIGMEARRIRRDGTEIIVELSSAPLRDSDGGVRGLMVMAVDVTERRRAEEAARRSEERYRALFQNMQSALAYCRMAFDGDDPRDFYYLEANPAFARVTGMPHPVGRWISELLPGIREANPGDFAIYGRVARTGRPEQFETYAPPLDRWFSVSAYSPGPDQFVIVFDDITARKKADELRQKTEERYRVLVESLEDVVYLMDLDGRIVFVNPAVGTYGYAPEEVIGRPFREFVHPEDLAMVEAAVLATLRGEVRPVEFRALDRRGQARPARGHSRPIYEAGTLIGVSGVIVDLSAQRLVEEQLRAAQKMEAVGRLAGGIAHDFNNVLAVISSYAAFAIRAVPPEAPVRQELEEIQRAAGRAADLTRQLLAFSRKQVLRPERIDLNAIVGEMERMARRLIGDDIELCVQPDPELWPVQADRGQVEQVVMNLVVNSRDAMPHGGRLTIATANVDLGSEYCAHHLGATPGPYALLSVTDTGCGMDESTRSRIFEPFFTTKEPGKGTGLGLATVYGIVQQSGGSIAVSSEIGSGTTFSVYLPRACGELTARPRPTAEPGPTCGTETILLVEDDDGVRNAAERILGEAGYRVVTAANGVEAVSQSDREPRIDLLLTDLAMPGLSGSEVAARLRAERTGLRVVYMSGYADDATFLRDTAESAVALVTKPFTAEQLTRAVRGALDAPSPSGIENRPNGVA